MILTGVYLFAWQNDYLSYIYVTSITLNHFFDDNNNQMISSKYLEKYLQNFCFPYIYYVMKDRKISKPFRFHCMNNSDLLYFAKISQQSIPITGTPKHSRLIRTIQTKTDHANLKATRKTPVVLKKRQTC